MATQTATQTRLNTIGNDGYRTAWTLANGDDGAPFDNAGAVDKSVQVQGTFGAAGSVQIEGSNDGVNWQILRDPLGNNLVFTAAGLKAVLEATLLLRPRCTAGDGTTALVVSLLAMRRPQYLV
jgi:hypothetical protein